MPDRRPARLLAPLALVAFVVLVVLIIGSTGGGGSKSSTTKSNRTATTRARPPAKPRTYTVKSGDTSLDSIARKTGVATDRLLQLNPSLDPQTLVPGQRIKLRQ
ncbi:MAG: LysM peptidoglycan-binding domain-containing protein [Thermoleophilaceae bacterium]